MKIFEKRFIEIKDSLNVGLYFFNRFVFHVDSTGSDFQLGFNITIVPDIVFRIEIIKIRISLLIFLG